MSFRSFSSDRRGSSFEIEASCYALKTPLNCSVSFGSPNGTLTFGFFARGNFEANADIAGTGIYVALLVQAFFIYLLAIPLALTHSKRSWVSRCYHMLFTISDIMTILTVAYMINFELTGKCSMSTYHYYVAFDSVLIACSCILAVFTTSGRRYWDSFAGVFRFLAMLIIFVLLGVFLGYQALRHWSTDFPEWNPPDTRTRNDSTLLLPASCFLDPSLIATRSPYAGALDEQKMSRIGWPVRTYELPEIWIYIFLVVTFVGASIAYAYNWLYKCKYRSNPFITLRGFDMRWLWAITLLPCLGTYFFCAWHIFRLRQWARLSGWMRDESEDDWSSVGQLLPLLTLLLLLTSGFDYELLARNNRYEYDMNRSVN